MRTLRVALRSLLLGAVLGGLAAGLETEVLLSPGWSAPLSAGSDFDGPSAAHAAWKVLGSVLCPEELLPQLLQSLASPSLTVNEWLDKLETGTGTLAKETRTLIELLVVNDAFAATISWGAARAKELQDAGSDYGCSAPLLSVVVERSNGATCVVLHEMRVQREGVDLNSLKLLEGFPSWPISSDEIVLPLSPDIVFLPRAVIHMDLSSPMHVAARLQDLAVLLSVREAFAAIVLRHYSDSSIPPNARPYRDTNVIYELRGERTELVDDADALLVAVAQNASSTMEFLQNLASASISELIRDGNSEKKSPIDGALTTPIRESLQRLALSRENLLAGKPGQPVLTLGGVPVNIDSQLGGLRLLLPFVKAKEKLRRMKVPTHLVHRLLNQWLHVIKRKQKKAILDWRLKPSSKKEAFLPPVYSSEWKLDLPWAKDVLRNQALLQNLALGFMIPQVAASSGILRNAVVTVVLVLDAAESRQRQFLTSVLLTLDGSSAALQPFYCSGQNPSFSRAYSDALGYLMLESSTEETIAPHPPGEKPKAYERGLCLLNHKGPLNRESLSQVFLRCGGSTQLSQRLGEGPFGEGSEYYCKTKGVSSITALVGGMTLKFLPFMSSAEVDRAAETLAVAVSTEFSQETAEVMSNSAGMGSIGAVVSFLEDVSGSWNLSKVATSRQSDRLRYSLPVAANCPEIMEELTIGIAPRGTRRTPLPPLLDRLVVTDEETNRSRPVVVLSAHMPDVENHLQQKYEVQVDPDWSAADTAGIRLWALGEMFELPADYLSQPRTIDALMKVIRWRADSTTKASSLDITRLVASSIVTSFMEEAREEDDSRASRFHFDEAQGHHALFSAFTPLVVRGISTKKNGAFLQIRAQIDPFTATGMEVILFTEFVARHFNTEVDLLVAPAMPKEGNHPLAGRIGLLALQPTERPMLPDIPVHSVLLPRVTGPARLRLLSDGVDPMDLGCDVDTIQMEAESFVVTGRVLGSIWSNRQSKTLQLTLVKFSSGSWRVDSQLLVSPEGHFELAFTAPRDAAICLPDGASFERDGRKKPLQLTIGEEPRTCLPVSAPVALVRPFAVTMKPAPPEPAGRLIDRIFRAVRTPVERLQRFAARVTSHDVETVHVFSVAAGFTYERLLLVMMRSVREHTPGPLHFWIADPGFLSPRGRHALREAAEHLPDVTVSLVAVQWPAWVVAQTEFHRVVWAYKVLFLDLLFPADLPRIIFVDADQVWRSDIRRLWNADLHGAPYGFTPFCQGKKVNPETTGYRFWDSGFWKSHLQGRPYHISALYVVDLNVLRSNGIGAALRRTYNSLAISPNSLANLDQDLPNYMQTAGVPIHSLPPEALWCESWCSLEAKSSAWAIDLCNSPLRKEPKLDQARRIIPEWIGYDKEMYALWMVPNTTSMSNPTSMPLARVTQDEL